VTTGDAIDNANRRARTILARLADRLTRELTDLIASLDTTDGVTEQTRHNLDQVLRIREQTAQVAQRIGVPDVIGQLRAALPDVVAETLKEFPELGNFAPQITSDLLRVLQGQEIEIARVLTAVAADEVASAVRASVTGALSITDITSRVARTMEVSMARAATTIDRAVRDFHETTARLQVDNVNEAAPPGQDLVFIYAGPVDSLTRPYCRKRVNKILTSAQVEALDPTERYNCRHRPAPILRSLAEAQDLPYFTM